MQQFSPAQKLTLFIAARVRSALDEQLRAASRVLEELPSVGDSPVKGASPPAKGAYRPQTHVVDTGVAWFALAIRCAGVELEHIQQLVGQLRAAIRRLDAS